MLNIEIWSDVVCPWCYVGKRRFEAAVAEVGADVNVTWRSFELDPSAPTEPRGPLDEHLASKYGVTLERARGMMDHMTSMAAAEGLDFDFSIAKGGNTLDAHRLIHFAAEHGKQDAMKERLLRAYMCDGEPITNRDRLAELAAELELDASEVRDFLETERFVDDVRRDEVMAHQIGVRGVPFFLVERKYAISGAQPTDVMVQALQRVIDETSQPQVVDLTSGGEVCDDEGCRVPAEPAG